MVRSIPSRFPAVQKTQGRTLQGKTWTSGKTRGRAFHRNNRYFLPMSTKPDIHLIVSPYSRTSVQIVCPAGGVTMYHLIYFSGNSTAKPENDRYVTIYRLSGNSVFSERMRKLCNGSDDFPHLQRFCKMCIHSGFQAFLLIFVQINAFYYFSCLNKFLAFIYTSLVQTCQGSSMDSIFIFPGQ